jgi:hypothetical protein
MTRGFVVLTMALAAVAGCGGGDDDGGNGPSRQEFVGDANAICREGEQKISEVSQERQDEIRQAKSPEEQRKAVADVLETTVEAYRPYLDRLRDLEPPADLQGDWSNFLDDIGEAFDLIPELAEATRDGDRERLSELTTDFTRIAAETRPFAEKTGLDDCLPDEGTQ